MTSNNQNDENSNGRSAGLKSILKGLIYLVLMGGTVVLVRQAGLLDAFDTGWMDSQVKGHGLYGRLLYVGATALFTALGLPRQVFCFMGGYGFGFLEGTLWATTGSALGCMLTVFSARLLGREMVGRYMGNKIKKVDDFISKRPFTMAMTIRFFPLGSNLVTNLAAGVSSIPVWPFIMGSVVGYLPQTIVFTLFGSGINVSSTYRIVLSVALLVLSTAMGVVLYRKHRADKRTRA